MSSRGMLSYDSITVSSAWELTSVSMRYSQGEGVNTSLSRITTVPTSWCTSVSPSVGIDSSCVVVVVVVVDSHIQRIVLATEETTATQQVSHRPIKRQSRLWSQRGTKVNGSHHGDNPLLRPTGIQIATKSYAALQAMAPTNIKYGVYGYLPWHGHVLSGTLIIKIMCVNQIYLQG